MHVVIVPDSFKGTMTSVEVIKAIKRGVIAHFPNTIFTEIPIADGGEGTVEAVVSALNGEMHTCKVLDALGRECVARFGICGKIGVIEMAEAAGITRLNKNELNPLVTTSYGVGQLILEALKFDVDQLLIGIGGSATNDGGTGMLQALGAKFKDEAGNLLGYGGQILHLIDDIDISEIDQRVFEIPITVMCDVSNPLTGPMGATWVYGRQKGGDDSVLNSLEQGMLNYKAQLTRLTNLDADQISGSGAAGGLGAAFVCVLKSKLKSGIESILDLVHFESLIEQADLVITGEGKIDEQTLYGKVPTGVSNRCVGKKAKVVAIVGTEGPGARKVYHKGIDAIVSTVSGHVEEAMVAETAVERLEMAVDTMCRLLKIGQTL